MYGFSPERWKYICKNLDLDNVYIEVYAPHRSNADRISLRKKCFEKLGHEVIPYEDTGVSVGIFILRKDR
ncbi:MAG: hypothetical protein DRR06_17395 [Gammaproteobacteria bacterium]|nr:MAG: hypothetical protein DRR06_17395 [Gammaproteobacteria bacterium]